ncbi:hypothetical protein [Pseudomonas sp. PLMAX]|uniref:hypothetical protein n=1 Tax=Pseudomonas sp. PLMAX TaxID=2201998 RepID=UPI0038BA0443
MIDFHNKNLEQHEQFSKFSKACRALRTSNGDPLLVDMLIESFPPELRGPALLHAHWLAANFNSKKLLAYTEGHGIHQKHPALQQSVEIANLILRNFFRQGAIPHPEFLEILQNTTQRLGAGFAMDIIDQAFSTDNDKVAERLELAKTIISSEVFRSLEVGNHTACRLAVCCEEQDLKDHNKQVLKILDVVRDCAFDDIGSINIILVEDTVARTDKIFPQIEASYLPALRNGLNYERLSMLPTALKIMPKALLSEVMSFDDADFKRLVRGQFLDTYLSSGWMEPIGSLDRRYKEQEFSEIVRGFNARLMLDESIRAKVEHHPSVMEGEFEGMELLYLLPELQKIGIHPAIEDQDTTFAQLVDFAKPYEHMQDLYEAGIEVIRCTYQRKAEKLYEDVFNSPELKVKLKNPDSVTGEYKLGQMAVILMCELHLRDRAASDDKQLKLAPIDYMISKSQRRDLDWVTSDVLHTYARSMPEEEVVQAAGKRKACIKLLVDQEVLGKEHYAKLSLKDRSAAFIKEMGV